MARATASAVISFALVTIPVKLYLAAKAEQVSFNLLSPEAKARVKQQLVCSETNVVVDRDKCFHGYEYAKNQYVAFTKDEITALEEPRTKTIDIIEFVPLSTVDLIQVEKSYYLGTDKGGDKAYRLLNMVMVETDRVAIGRWAARGKDQLIMIRPYKEGLIMHQMYYANEVRAFEELPAPVPVRDEEIALAKSLIKELEVDAFNSSKYHDQFAQRVAEAVEKKAAGQNLISIKQLPAATVLDIVSALKASLDKQPAKKAVSKKKSKKAG